ncbi:MAG: prolipoprotein diacylglyceryl transferase [candidate division WOR-3 bacterium]|jgi:phosphatidylglycerol:prolipoprotein diacylglycerol transferase
MFLLILIFGLVLEFVLYFTLKDLNINPVIFTIGSLQIRYYGLMYVIAIVLALYFLRYDFKKFNINVNYKEFEDAAFWVIIFAILGARIYHVIPNWDYYSKNPFEIIAVWHGGLAIYGGIIGGLISGYIIAKIKKWNFLKLADIIIPYLALGQAIGRWGNFFNKEAYGPPSDVPWAIYIPYENRIKGFENYEYFHPTFWYESILNYINFVFLLYFRDKFYKNDGQILSLYILNYGIIRFFIEFQRFDTDTFLGIRIAHIFSIIAIIIGIVGFILASRGK